MRKLCSSQHVRSLYSLGLLLSLGSLIAAGCTKETEPSSTGSQSDPNVYASSSLGKDDNPGTQAAPVKTIAKAVSLASAKKGMVFACAETFVEPLQVQGAAHVMGGFDCTKPDWPSIASTQKTTLTAGPDEWPLHALASMDAAHFEDMIIQASDSVNSGGSSIAVFADNGAVLEFMRCEIKGGNGAAGAPGMQPSGTAGPSDPADPTIKGIDGNNSCMGGMNGNIGGEGKINDACNTAIGGNGGNALETEGVNGADGQPVPVPNDMGYGLGGLGALNGNQCTTGKSGLVGIMGVHGLGATTLGTLDSNGFMGAIGEPGKLGGPGQGGGGGGGAIGKLGCYGASGAGGGAGGCGGAGGGGGLGGGASFAIVSMNAKFSFTETMLSTGLGGHGGDGGSGQAGGVGGAGGKGGAPSIAGLLAGCDGGSGGPGGIGGTGGGGRGGHSVAVAYVGTAPDLTGVTIQLGMPGKGGTGSGDMLDMSAGMDGELADTLSFETGTK